MLTATRHRRLADLDPVKSDSLLALIALANADTRPEKIDVGVGVYKDGSGRTPVMRSVKAAEKLLWERQDSKAYLGGAGDTIFPKLIAPILLGDHADDQRILGLQTPGGCGALTLGMMLITAANREARVLVGLPTWPNHVPIVVGAGLEPVTYDYYDRDAHKVRFDVLMAAVGEARPGHVVLLQGGCHNPTGADLDPAQWADVTAAIVERQLLPVIDLAYQGLGRGLEEDAAGLRGILDACDEVIVAQSCDKNFGVYRDRVGCLYLKTESVEASKIALGHVLQIAREMWSMPPDHGAAVVRTVLEDVALRTEWLQELDQMRGRVLSLRARLAAAHPELAFIATQNGMFSMLPLSPAQVLKLRQDHAIYMADSGRFNILGLADDAVDRFVGAVVGVMGE
ncbi:MAG: aromatic amino acid transaminase [Sphingomonas bacterium]|nr:aromatic amino acid transaminase [Sphingomonas bacterium]